MENYSYQNVNKNENELNFAEVWSVIRRRKKFMSTIFFSTLGVILFFTAYQRTFNPVFLGKFTLLINDPLNKKNSSSVSDGIIENLARNTTDNDIPTLMELLKSPYLISSLAKKYNISNGSLSNRINITPGGKDRFDKRANGILKVSLRSRKPNNDILLLKDLSELYLQTALNQKRKRLSDGLDFLNKQAPELASKTAELQTELSLFRQNNSLLEPNVEGGALKKLEEDIVVEILRLETERERLEKVNKELKNGNLNVSGFETGIDPNKSSNYTFQGKGLGVSANDQGILKEILLVKQDLAKALSRYQPSSKRVISLKERLKQLEPNLISNQQEAVETALKLNMGRLNTAKKQREKLKQTFSKQPELIKEFETIQQKLKIAQENLSGLISARETFQLEMAQRSFPWTIIEAPFISRIPISPSLPKNLVYGIFFAAVVSFILGLLREWSDYVYHSITDIEETLKIPLLANIPYVESFKNVKSNNSNLLQAIEEFIKQKKDNKESQYQRFFYQESLRSLYTSLRFAGSDKPLKIIELTSCIPSEGKSLINILFAKTLAEIGKKVLLVDLDLRRPQIHNRLALNNIIGVSNLLTDNNLELKDAIQNVDKYPNWDVITSGIRPPDPTLLLSSEKMVNFVDELRLNSNYDLVLFDTTPLIGISDAALISDLTDALIIIISLDNVNRSLPKEALKLVKETNSIKLGFIANSINLSKVKSNAYGYNYSGYKYGYGYGYADYAAYIEGESEKNYIEKQNSPIFYTSTIDSIRKLFKKFSDWIDK